MASRAGMSTKFQTPDGPRFVTHFDGARVVGDESPTQEDLVALQELVDVARKRLEPRLGVTTENPLLRYRKMNHAYRAERASKRSQIAALECARRGVAFLPAQSLRKLFIQGDVL